MENNSRWCCIAAKGDQVVADLVSTPWRDNTRGSLTPTIHTKSWLIPIIIRWHQICSNLNRQQSWCVLPCHHIILVASIAVAYTLSQNCVCHFLRETECVQDWRYLLEATTLIIWCVWKLNLCPFYRKWQVLHIYDIFVLQQVGMFPSCKQTDSHWFQGVKCVLGQCHQPYFENIS